MRYTRIGAAFAVLVLGGCGEEQPNPTSPVIVNVVTVIGGTDTGATPTPIPGAGAIAAVRVAFFGGSCPAGAGDVRNGAPVAVGCTGFATATPVDTAGNKLEPAVHGVSCLWSTDRTDVVRIQIPGDNQFNADIVALRPGIARVSANVKGVVGQFDVEVR